MLNSYEGLSAATAKVLEIIIELTKPEQPHPTNQDVANILGKTRACVNLHVQKLRTAGRLRADTRRLVLADSEIYEKPVVEKAPRPSDQERFKAFVTVDPDTGCWLWDGSHAGGEKCYGHFSLNGKSLCAHRAAYLLFIADVIPKGDHRGSMCVTHVDSCPNSTCCNPEHLKLGTSADMVAYREARRKFRSPKITSLPLNISGQELKDLYG